MENGWIKLHRKILENPLSYKPSYLALWIHIILMANHKQNKMMWNGDILSIHEGQFITGRKELSRKTGIPETTIEDILNFLEKQHQIRQQKTTKFRLIEVINWEKYQYSDIKSDNKATTKRQQSDTNKKDNNDKNEKNIILHSEQGSQIDEVMKVFYKINPTLNWKNKTVRKAAADLIKGFGLKETIQMAEAVTSIQGKPYAPVATTPHHMKEKLAQFKIYFDKEKNNKPNVIKI